MQLGDNIKKARRDLRESVWRSYNNVALLGKNNEVRFIDLGKAHSSAAKDIIQFILNELMNVDEVQKGISPNLLVRNWTPSLPEWSTKSVRDAFYASPLFPRLLSPEAIKETIARGVSNGQIAYVGKAGSGKYLAFNFEKTLTSFDVEVSEEMNIITKENAEAYRSRGSQPVQLPPAQPTIPGINVDPVSQPAPPTGRSGAANPPTGAQSDPKSGPEPVQLPLALT